MSRKRRIFVAAGLAAALTVAAAALALIFAPSLARRLAVERAAEHGVALEPGEVTVGFGSVTVRNARFHLIGLPAVRGTVGELHAAVRWTTPVGLRLHRVDIEAVGSAPALALGATEWAKRYPRTFALPTEASEVTFTWRQAERAEPWLTLSGGTVSRSGDVVHCVADRSVLGLCAERDAGAARCPDLGKVGAAWTADQAVVRIGLGVEDVAQAPLRIEVRHALAQPTADITLAPVDLARLAGPLGSKLPVKNVTASATVRLVMPAGLDGGAVTGTLEASLKGYVPPHPRELDGFVFGDTTTLTASLRVDEARARADLADVRVTAGAFKLAGTGSIAREGDHGAVRLDLTGNLPCSALAGAAVDSHLGRALGGIAGQLARQLVQGSVSVSVSVAARTDDLPGAKVTKTLGVGCGLRPLAIGGVDVGQLLEGKLPPLPSGLPPLPQLELEREPTKPGTKASPP